MHPPSSMYEPNMVIYIVYSSYRLQVWY